MIIYSVFTILPAIPTVPLSFEVTVVRNDQFTDDIPLTNTYIIMPARRRTDKNEQTYNLAAYLIAQLGKNFNDKVKGRITGQELLEAAIRQTQILQYQAGGMVAFVEADNKEKLLSFYENYGFKRFDTRQKISDVAEPHELVQLLILL